MKILHTESSLGWGGQENRTFNELLGLRELGYSPLLACQPGARLGVRARELDFEVIDIPMRGSLDLVGLWKLRQLMGSRRIDILNTHSGRDTQLAGMAAHSLGKSRPRVVRTRHLALPITSTFSYVTLPDHVVAVSCFVRDYLKSAGVRDDHVSAVPTGIDLSRYPTGEPGSLRKELNLSSETLLIGTVAILRRKKGHAELLEAVPTVLAKFPDTHFVFAGDGPQHENLAQRIGELGLGEKVHLLGLRRDVPNVLRSLDLFVLPTHQEALGTAFIEAGAIGLPSVATRVDGVPEVVMDGETGLLVSVNDSPAIAQAIISLLSDGERRKTMGVAAQALVKNRFSREVMVRDMLALYERLLGLRAS